MKIVQILGGLGNQMFQYALAVVLREKFKDEVFIDTTTFKTYPLHNGYELDKIFNITIQQAKKEQIATLYHHFTESYNMVRIYKHLFPKKKNEFREIEAQPFNPQIFIDNGNNYYSGYWQDYNYFIKHISAIRKEFEYKTDLYGKNQEYYEKFVSENYISVHIRKGDYATAKGFGEVCNSDYFKKSISYIKEKISTEAKFAFFSNDFDWVKKEIVPIIGNNFYVFVDWNTGKDSYNDMRLMSACKTNILSNSSFSWWAAFLNTNKNPIVIAPQKWNIYQECRRQLPEWILI